MAADLGGTPILVAPLGGEPGEIIENMLDSRVSLRRVAVRASAAAQPMAGHVQPEVVDRLESQTTLVSAAVGQEKTLSN